MAYSGHRQRPSYPVYEGWPPQYEDVRFVEGGPLSNAGLFQPHPGQSAPNAFTVVVLEAQLFICAPSPSTARSRGCHDLPPELASPPTQSLV